MCFYCFNLVKFNVLGVFPRFFIFHFNPIYNHIWPEGQSFYNKDLKKNVKMNNYEFVDCIIFISDVLIVYIFICCCTLTCSLFKLWGLSIFGTGGRRSGSNSLWRECLGMLSRDLEKVGPEDQLGTRSGLRQIEWENPKHCIKVNYTYHLEMP